MVFFHIFLSKLSKLLSKFQCGFRKGFNAQHCLLVMIEKWSKTLDKGGETGAVLTDVSKAFDCIDHNFLIAKLDAYGFEKQSISSVKWGHLAHNRVGIFQIFNHVKTIKNN